MEQNMITISMDEYKELLKVQMQVEQIKYGLSANFRYDSDKINYIKVALGLDEGKELS